MLKGYLGTLLSDGSEGIFSFEFNEAIGKFNNIKLFSNIKNSIFLIHKDGFIFALFKDEDEYGLVVLNDEGELIDKLIFETLPSSFLIKNEDFIYVVNGKLGSITKLSFINNKLNLIFIKVFEKNAGCSQIIPFKNKFLLPCTNLDKILILNSDLDILDTIFLDKNSGPKQGLISLDNKYLYLTAEAKDMIYTYEIVDDEFYLIDRVSSLPIDEENIHGTSNLYFNHTKDKIFVSILGLNLIGSFDISNTFPVLIKHIPTYGNYPMDFKLISSDRFIICANRLTDSLTSISLESSSKTDELHIKGPVNISINE